MYGRNEMEQTNQENCTKKTSQNPSKENLISALKLLDPILQFLTKATGNPSIPFATLQSTFPKVSQLQKIKDNDLHSIAERSDFPKSSCSETKSDGNKATDTEVKLCHESLLHYVQEFSKRGILSLQEKRHNNGFPSALFVGFPQISSDTNLNQSNTCNVSKNEIISKDSKQKTSKVKEKKSKQSKPNTASLHGSTKAAAKRRLAALRRSLKSAPIVSFGYEDENDTNELEESKEKSDDDNKECKISRETQTTLVGSAKTSDHTNVLEKTNLKKESNSDVDRALLLLCKIFNSTQITKGNININSQTSFPSLQILPKQAAYAGCQPARPVKYGLLSKEAMQRIPEDLALAFSLKIMSNKTNFSSSSRNLFHHQTEAINAILSDRPKHTIVCTGTGSGKSLCFLLPVLSTAMKSNATSILIFPTKALAQDQYTKLTSILNSPLSSSSIKKNIRPGVIDGDTPHSERMNISESCNIILTNPDTLHAAILPGWKRLYRKLLGNLRYVVLDEAHVYDGIFGSHVSMVLSRLFRICMVAEMQERLENGGENGILNRNLSLCENRDISTNVRPSYSPIFIACSATLLNPELHFRSLCPIPKEIPVCILSPEDDGSPCAPKHFFVWNPPLLDLTGNSMGSVISKKAANTNHSQKRIKRRGRRNRNPRAIDELTQDETNMAPLVISKAENGNKPSLQQAKGYLRRHPAEETAIILANAMKNGIRCIAFCKTRSLVEWVFDRCISHLRMYSDTVNLVSKVESYRGGYSADVRRDIERKLFRNELLAVVGTSALELGVDIGGIDLTLHCGYPGSLPSLLQQSGRAGRGGRNRASFSIVVCFSSPAEQHMWKKPEGILSKKLSYKTGEDAISPISFNPGVIRGHMLCASAELPLTGEFSSLFLLGNVSDHDNRQNVFAKDHNLFGNIILYQNAIQTLLSRGLLQKETITYRIDRDVYLSCLDKENMCRRFDAFRAHPVSRLKYMKHLIYYYSSHRYLHFF